MALLFYAIATPFISSILYGRYDYNDPESGQARDFTPQLFCSDEPHMPNICVMCGAENEDDDEICDFCGMSNPRGANCDL